MILPHLPNESRVWFFGASRILLPAEIDVLNEQLNTLVSNWKSHGASLSAGFEILHESILIVAIDQSVESPSGCSIDKIFGLLKDQQIDFFQRSLVWRPYCNTTEILTLAEFKTAFDKEELFDDTLVVNSLVENLHQARENLYIPFSKHWAYKKINTHG